ncbi:unnamed protein product [Urochloa humidicola]
MASGSVSKCHGDGFGGHMVGHENREHAAAANGGAAVPAVAAVHRRNRNPRPERPHVCDQCGAAFRLGVQLGGHKRKHWAGPPIVPKRRKPRAVVAHQPLPAPPPEAVVADHALVLPVVRAANERAPPVATEAARPAVERTPEPAPIPAAAAAGRVLLFGIDIGPGVQAPEAQQVSPPATESSASIAGGKH